MTTVHDPEDARIQHRELTALVEAGATVDFAAPFSAYGRRVPSTVRAGIDVPRAVGRKRLRALRAARSLVGRAAGKYDSIVLHDPELLATVVGRRRLRRQVRIVWDMHEDVATLAAIRAWVPRILRPVVRSVAALAVRWAERNVEVIVAERSYARHFAEPPVVVPNTVRVPPLDEGPRSGVIYVGRLTTARGAREMISLARALHPTVASTLVGPADSDIEPLLAAAERDGVLTWRGFVPNPEAMKLLDSAQVGLSLLHNESNYAESEPTKVMEYLAHGVLPVTTSNPASARLVDASGVGRVVPFGDVDAAVAAVKDLLDSDDRSATARAAHAYAAEHLDWNSHARTFVDFVSGTPLKRD